MATCINPVPLTFGFYRATVPNHRYTCGAYPGADQNMVALKWWKSVWRISRRRSIYGYLSDSNTSMIFNFLCFDRPSQTWPAQIRRRSPNDKKEALASKCAFGVCVACDPDPALRIRRRSSGADPAQMPAQIKIR